MEINSNQYLSWDKETSKKLTYIKIKIIIKVLIIIINLIVRWTQ